MKTKQVAGKSLISITFCQQIGKRGNEPGVLTTWLRIQNAGKLNTTMKAALDPTKKDVLLE